MKKLFPALLLCLLFSLAFCVQNCNAAGAQGGTPSIPAGQVNGNSQNGSVEANESGTGQERTETQTGQETGKGKTLQTETQERNEGEEQALSVQARVQANKLNQTINEAQAKYAGEISGMPSQQAQIYRNQNKVRVAVQALLSVENLTGIGKNVSAIAREFNNSVQATIRSEERTMQRSGIERFFFGGDENAAGELEQQAFQNRQRITRMQQLMLQCDSCDPEVKSLIQEQLQNMEQEQTRLTQLAQREKQDKGIFGWLWK